MTNDVFNRMYDFETFINSTGFTISVLLFMGILFTIYYRKKKSGYSVSALFFALLDMVFFPLVLEVLSYAAVCFLPLDYPFRERIIDICFKGYIIFSMFWIVLFIYYVIILIAKHVFKKMQGDEKKFLKFRVFIYVIVLIGCSVLGILLPYKVMYTGEGGTLYLYGPAYYLINLELIISFLVLLIVLFVYKKHIPNSYMAPFLVLFVLYLLLMILSFTSGFYSNNLPSFFGYLTATLFFTIESQDIQILTQYKKNKELKELSRINRQKLLTNMSHEVRTPLYNIMGYGEFIKNNNLIDDVKIDYLNNINNSTLVLKNIINNIVDVASIQNNNIEILNKDFYCRELYLSVNNFVIQNKKDNVVFTFDYSKDIPSVLSGDAIKVFKIITNVILNAYSCVEYGEVKLDIKGNKLDSQNFETIYTISNSGHVMSQELFEYDIDAYISNAKSIDYVKLGFITAKKYIEMLGGKIEFINETGKGTQYIIKLKNKIVNDAPVGNLM